MFVSRLTIAFFLMSTAAEVSVKVNNDAITDIMQKANINRVLKSTKEPKTSKGPKESEKSVKETKGPKNPKVPKQMILKASKSVKKEKGSKEQKEKKSKNTKEPTNAPTLPPVIPVVPTLQSGSTSVTVIITTDDYPQETSFQVQSNGQVFMAGGAYTGTRTTYSDTKNLPDGIYTFIISDSFGDGMCCAFGNGGYNLFVNNALVKAGGVFATTETVIFSTGSSPVNPPTPVPTTAPIACGSVTVIITTDDFPGETSYQITDLSGKLFMTGNSYTGKRTTYSSTQCLPYAVYQFTISDLKGDGMCCAKGNGGYNLYANNILVKAGGVFTYTDNVLFSSQGAPVVQPPSPTLAPTSPPPPTNSPTKSPITSPTNAPNSPTNPPTNHPTSKTELAQAQNLIQPIQISTNINRKMTSTEKIIFCNEKQRESYRSPGATDVSITCNVVDDYIKVSRRRSRRFLESTITQYIHFNMIWKSNIKTNAELLALEANFYDQANSLVAKTETCNELISLGYPCKSVQDVIVTSSERPSGPDSPSGNPSAKPSAKTVPPTKTPTRSPTQSPTVKQTNAPTNTPTTACVTSSFQLTQSTFNTAIAAYRSNPTTAEASYGPIAQWNVVDAYDMEGAFLNFVQSSPNVRCWDVSRVTNMKNMFKTTVNFNNDISSWDVQRVTSMEGMFENNNSFNQNINKWNVGNVVILKYMFKSAINFKNSVEDWNVAKVTDMTSMFEMAISFNHDLSRWDITNTKQMENMFKNDSSFKQNLCDWKAHGGFPNAYDFNNMFAGTRCSQSDPSFNYVCLYCN